MKLQKTITTDGEGLWKDVLYTLVDDTDWDVSHAAKESVGMNRDSYAEIHSAPKQKKKKKTTPFAQHPLTLQIKRPELQLKSKVFWVNNPPFKSLTSSSLQ